MEIVKFDDGTYGIRKGTSEEDYKYKDLKSRKDDINGYWWPACSQFISECKSKSLSEVRDTLSKLEYRPTHTVTTYDYGQRVDISTPTEKTIPTEKKWFFSRWFSKDDEL